MRRTDALTAIAKLEDKRDLGRIKLSPAQIDMFCRVLKMKLTDPDSALGKAYLRLVVDEIRLDGNQLTVRGGYGKLADALGALERKELGEVPSSVRVWRARQDLNPPLIRGGEGESVGC